MIILVLIGVLVFARASDDCFFKNPTNAASTPATVINVVNGILTQKIEPLVSGLVIDDYAKLNDGGSFFKVNMKVSKVSWCSERPNNKGKLVMLQTTIQEDAGNMSSPTRDLTQIGSKSSFCYSWSITQSQYISAIDVNFDQNSIISAQFNTFDGTFKLMGSTDVSASFDRISFTSMNSMIGLYASLDQNSTFIKTLGAYVNTCGLSAKTSQILDQYGFAPKNPAVMAQETVKSVPEQINTTAIETQTTLALQNVTSTDATFVPVPITNETQTKQLFAWLVVSLAFSFMLLVVIIGQFFYFARVTRKRQRILEAQFEVAGQIVRQDSALNTGRKLNTDEVLNTSFRAGEILEEGQTPYVKRFSSRIQHDDFERLQQLTGLKNSPEEKQRQKLPDLNYGSRMSDWGVPCTQEANEFNLSYKPQQIQDTLQPTFGRKVLESNYNSGQQDIFTEPNPNNNSDFDIVDEELKRVHDELGSQLQLMHTENQGHKPNTLEEGPLDTEMRLTQSNSDSLVLSDQHGSVPWH